MRLLTAVALMATVAPQPVSGHRLDEYLQATLIGLTRDGVDVEINLTPGVAVLPAVMAVIDRDGNGLISDKEARAYASRVAREVELRLDGKPAALHLTRSGFPKIEEMEQGLGTIRLRFHTTLTGRELRFENHHLPQISAYLVNCLAAPGDGLTVTRQQRDEAQKSIRFNYTFKNTPRLFWLAALAMLLAGRLAVLRRRNRRPDQSGCQPASS